jgi:hypothetical protein
MTPITKIRTNVTAGFVACMVQAVLDDRSMLLHASSFEESGIGRVLLDRHQ